MPPGGQQVRGPAQRVRHRLRLVVVVERGQVTPRGVAAELDEPRAELEPEDEPEHREHDEARRRGGVAAEERDREAGLAEQHLPAEAVERLPDAHDREVEAVEREEREHRQPVRAALGEAEDEQRRDDGADHTDRAEQAIGVAPPEQRRRA